jgi:hypothetical protein
MAHPIWSLRGPAGPPSEMRRLKDLLLPGARAQAREYSERSAPKAPKAPKS